MGDVYLTEKAVTTCAGGFINYSYKIDLGNNGSIDIQSSEDTVHQAFPVGTHQIIWRASDNCGNLSTACSYLFTIKDCNPPNLLCLNGLTQNLEAPECSASFNASDFIINVNDNCTPNNQLEFGLRESGAGTGFPTDTTLNFDICDKGLHVLQIWVRDENNLTNQCNSYVLVQENNGACVCHEFAKIDLQGCVMAPDSAKLDNYTIRAELAGNPPGGPLNKNLQKTFTSDSCFTLSFADLPVNGPYTGTVRAQRFDDPLNGVSTFDLVLINKHILGQQALANFYQVFAADVNQSQTVTTFDIIEIRKLILGVYDTFPTTPPWRFIRPVADPSNLTNYAAVRDTYAISIDSLWKDTALNGLQFIGIKMGDVNTNAFLIGPPEDRMTGAPATLIADDVFLQPGATQWIPLRLTEVLQLDGWQLALHAEPSLLEILDVRGVPPSGVAITPEGDLRIACVNAGPVRVGAVEPLIYVLVRANAPGWLSAAFRVDDSRLRPEVYPAEGASIRPLQFRVGQEPGPEATVTLPQPNPFAESTVFGLSLHQDMPVLLEVFDLTGRLVYQTASRYPAGNHRLTVPAGALPASGVWLYRIQAGNTVRTGKLLRL